MKILIINGPNLNLLGQRNINQYGEMTLEQINQNLKVQFPSINFEFIQSNVEGELVNTIQEADQNYEGIIINAGGYTHTSVAIRDAIEAIATPVIEVHISNISNRESFRHTSFLSPVCQGCIFGFGSKSYSLAVQALV